jgi:hypothetical protein
MKNTKPATTAKQCKAAGLDSLDHLAQLTGKNPHTLRRWSVEQPMFFRVVLRGAVMEAKDHA